MRAEQHVVQEGQSPSGARMRSAISKSGGNASLAGGRLLYSGGQGVHQVDQHKMESEGHEEKYRAVIDGGYPEDEPVGQRWGKVESALWRARINLVLPAGEIPAPLRGVAASPGIESWVRGGNESD